MIGITRGPAAGAVLAGAAITLTIPAMLATAGVAHADNPLQVNFVRNTQGISAIVAERASGVSLSCIYHADPQGLTLLQPVEQNFTLGPPTGRATLNFPGIPTGTIWKVHIGCADAAPGTGDTLIGITQPPPFDDIVTY